MSDERVFSGVTEQGIHYIRLNHHHEECYAVPNVIAGTWSTEWAYISGESRWLDKLGRTNNGGQHRWRSIECNCTYCPAKILIREDDVLNMVSMFAARAET